MKDELEDAESAAVTATATGDAAEAEGLEEDAISRPGQVPELSRGSAIGRYLVVDHLGLGGSGMVYSAFDPDLDRKVALKLLRRYQQEAARTRLLREAQAMAKLDHPNVVTVFEVDTDRGRDFVAMEFVDGQNLDDWAKERAAQAIHNKETVDEVLRVYRDAGRGLAAAHAVGLVHRDFKPHNVLIDIHGRVRVTDFGLARDLGEQAGLGSEASSTDNPRRAHDLTRTGAVMGTPAYMAPEQHEGKSADARSDQYAFCVALYEALAGSRPFRGDNYRELKEAVLQNEVPTLPDALPLSSNMRAAITKGMAKSPSERHESMGDILEALNVALAPAPSRRSRLLVPAILVSFAVLIAGAALLGAQGEDDRCRPEPTMLAGAWDEEIRGQLRTAFIMTQVEGAKEVYEQFASTVDDYAGELVTMRVQVCKASRELGGQSDELLARQMSCVSRRRQQLQALTTAFSNVDPRGLDQVLEAALDLDPVSACDDEEALRRGVPGPPPELRERAEELQASLREAESEGEAFRIKEAIARAEATKEEAQRLGYMPLQAEAYTVLAELYRKDVRLKEAEVTFEEAILAAEESGYTEYRARALVGITRLIASTSSRYADARRYARRARAAISQRGGAPNQQIDVDLAMAQILQQEGKSAEAERLVGESLQHHRHHPDAGAVYVARLQNRMASLKIELGDYDEAHTLAESSYELVRDELKDNNPRTVSFLGTLGITHRMRGEYLAARDIDKRLRSYWHSEKGLEILKESENFEHNVRRVEGVVRDTSDQPVAKAVVICAQRHLADARFLDATFDPEGAEIHRDQWVHTDNEGHFACDATSTKDLIVVGEHVEVGRTSVHRVPEGVETVDGLTLTLRASGFVSGRVTVDGKPAKAQIVSAVPVEIVDAMRPPFAAVTFMRADGSYNFERLAPGRYKVFAGPRDSRAVSLMQSKEVVVESGRGSKVDFDQSQGSAGLKVSVRGENNAPLPSAQILLVPGHFGSATGADFNRRMVTEDIKVRSFFWSRGEVLDIEGIEGGLHSVCVAPLGGDYRDPEYMRTLDKDRLDALLVHCRDVEVVPNTVTELVLEVPPMAPTIDINLDSSSEGGPS